VSYLPSDLAGARLPEVAGSDNPRLSLTAAAGLLLGGAGLCLAGFRRRRAHAAVAPIAT
jgi:hypothetical protein